MLPEKAILVLESYEKKLAETNSPALIHARSMCASAIEFFQDDRIEKAMRWLGFIQGVLWIEGVYSIDQMKNHNKPTV